MSGTTRPGLRRDPVRGGQAASARIAPVPRCPGPLPPASRCHGTRLRASGAGRKHRSTAVRQTKGAGQRPHPCLIGQSYPRGRSGDALDSIHIYPDSVFRTASGPKRPPGGFRTGGAKKRGVPINRGTGLPSGIAHSLQPRDGLGVMQVLLEVEMKLADVGVADCESAFADIEIPLQQCRIGITAFCIDGYTGLSSSNRLP
jgi:hypothetical protein